MRKKEIQITDLAGTLKIVDSCDICRLGVCDGKRISIKPMSFGYTFLNGKFTFYFHADPADKELKLLRNTEEIAFQMDSDHCMLPVENGEYAMLFNCAEGYGKPIFLETAEEKKVALKHILSHYLPGEEGSFLCKEWDEICVFKLEVTNLCCKIYK